MSRALLAILLLLAVVVNAQPSDSGYVAFRQAIITRFKNITPGKFGHAVTGLHATFQTDQKLMALTFDACGGPTGSGYDQELIDLLRKERIPATLFLAGSWIDTHAELVKELSADTLFEIENHGIDHCPCSVNGSSRYGIRGTESVSEAVDEIELNARKIEMLTGRKPVFYRSATASADEACVKIAKALGERIISYGLLSSDAAPDTPISTISNSLIRYARNGAIVIMHMNHPERNGFEGLRDALPGWQKLGYHFVKLEGQTLR